MTRVAKFLSAVLMLSWAAIVVHSSRGAEAVDHAAIEPYLADDVVSLAFVDVAAVDLPALIAAAQGLGMPEQLLAEPAQGAAQGQRIFDALAELGVGRAYALIRVSDVADQGCSWVLEVADDGDPEAVAQFLSGLLPTDDPSLRRQAVSFAPHHIKAHAGVVLAAMNEEQLRRVQAGTTDSPHAAAMEALSATGDADAGLLIFGDADSRRVVREMFPQLPAPFKEIDGRLIADRLKWGGLTLKFPPEPLAVVTIECADADVAQTMRQSMAKGLELQKIMLLAQLATGESSWPFRPAQLARGLGLLQPQVDGATLTLAVGDDESEIEFLRDLAGPALTSARHVAMVNRRMNRFKHIALAMHNFHSQKKSFPRHAAYGEPGHPLLSWRVLVLPYVDEQALYDEFHLDEPWDSPHNMKLIERMPDIYADPDPVVRAALGEGRTSFVVPFGEGLAFDGGDGKQIKEFTDGTSKTLLLVEVVPQRAVVWTKPDDWNVDLRDPLRGVERNDRPWFIAARCDGSVQTIDNGIDASVFSALLTRAGKEVIEP